MAARRGRPRKSAKEIQKQVSETVQVVKDNAESVVKEVKEAAEAKVEAAANATKAADEVVKETAKKVTDAAKSKGKAAGNKLASKAKEKTVDIGNFFEIDGQQIKVEDVIDRIKEQYKAEGHRIGAIKSMQVYYNFAERKAYYVINGKAENKFVSF